jgi:hypothetical protein
MAEALSLGSFATGLIPSGQTITNFFIWIGTGILVVGLLAVIVYLAIQKKKYNKTIMIFKMVGGEPNWTDTWKGMFERISLAGNYWLRCKNGRVLPRPIYEQKKGFYFYFEGADGELRNFKIDNIDEMLRKAGVVINKEDMRLTRLSIEELLKKRLQKNSWWAENKNFVANLILMIVVIIALMYVLGQIKELITSIGTLADVLGKSLAASSHNLNPATGATL